MPPPPTKRVKGKRREALGWTAEKCAEEAKTAVLPQPNRRPVSKATLVERERLRSYFNEYIETTPGQHITVSSRRVESYQGMTMLKPLPYPDDSVIQPFFAFLATRPLGRDKEAIDYEILRARAITFLALWPIDMGITPDVKARRRTLDIVTDLAKTHSLADANTTEAHLSAEGIRHLLRWMLLESGWAPQDRFTVALYLTLTVQGALHPFEAVVPSVAEVDTSTTGARVKHFQCSLKTAASRTVYISSKAGSASSSAEAGSRPTERVRKAVSAASKTPATEPNRAIALYTVPFSKTKSGEGREVPLPEPPHLWASSPIWFLLLAIMRGWISIQQTRAIFAPTFVTDEERGRRLIFPSEIRESHIFVRARSGRPVHTPWVTSKLREASMALGFEQLVTAYTPRQCAATHLVAAGVDSESIRALMGITSHTAFHQSNQQNTTNMTKGHTKTPKQKATEVPPGHEQPAVASERVSGTVSKDAVAEGLPISRKRKESVLDENAPQCGSRNFESGMGSGGATIIGASGSTASANRCGSGTGPSASGSGSSTNPSEDEHQETSALDRALHELWRILQEAPAHATHLFERMNDVMEVLPPNVDVMNVEEDDEQLGDDDDQYLEEVDNKTDELTSMSPSSRTRTVVTHPNSLKVDSPAGDA